jgi:signal transduction histidine kinase
LILIFRLILVLLLCAAMPCSWAGDRIVERAYFEDPGGSLTFADVQTKPLTPYAGVLSRGYTQSAIWLRLTIDPQTAAVSALGATGAPATLVLRIRPTYLDEIALFDPLQPRATPRVVGDRHPWSNNEYQSLNFNFVIPRGDAPRNVWLRLKTSSTSLILVEALDPSENAQSERRMELLNSGFLALLLLFMIWALVQWVTSREHLVGVFVIKQAVTIVYLLAYTGYLRLFLTDVFEPDWLDRLTSLTIVFSPAIAIFFDYSLLREYSPPRWGLRVLWLFLALLPIEVALIVAGKVQPALQINMGIVFLEPLVALGLAIAALWKRPKTRTQHPQPVLHGGSVVLMYALLVIGLSSVSLPSLGLIQSYDFVLNAFLVHALISGVLMMTMLLVRAHRMEVRRVQTQEALALSLQQTELERQQRMEQSKFLSMLTHELKTPLSVMRMVLGSKAPTPALVAHADKAVRDMNSVIERCLQADKLADGQVQVQASAVPLDMELHDLQRNSPDPSRVQLVVPEGVVLHTDAQVLRIVLANLVDNAFKYSAPGSVVAVTAATDDATGARPGVSIAVQNLPGIAGWPDATRVFQKYYRSPQAHHQTGSGLGLYLVASLAQMLGGEVRYSPTETHVRFILWLPL